MGSKFSRLCAKKEVGPADAYKKITLDDFTIMRAIGKGAFGKVSIVQKRKGGQQYALKYINKSKCIAEKAVHHIIQERNLLEELKHPFICNLRYSFQDSENLYMALDLMTGGDLRFHLGKPVKEVASRVILAEIASAIEFLHGHNVVHRDIKPDNILLDADGHAYLTDFNIAVKFREEKPLRSIAGTEPYMAPELLLGGGYFATVDWWSLGVMAYEMMVGERPFRGKHKRDLIKKGDWKFPANSMSSPTSSFNSQSRSRSDRRQERFPRLTETARSFISGLMTMDPTKRLGCGEEGKAALRAHPFFGDISWDKLVRKEVAPVFVPPRNKANFDATHDLEEILLNDNPLGSKPKNKKMDSSALTPEMIMLERQFVYYDWSRPDFVESQASAVTTSTPIASMDLTKVRESCLSMESTNTSRSMSMVKSRSTCFGNNSMAGTEANQALFRRAASGLGAGDVGDNQQMFRARALSQSRRDDTIPRGTSGAGFAAATGSSGSGNVHAPAIPPIPNIPVTQKILLDDTKAALRIGPSQPIAV